MPGGPINGAPWSGIATAAGLGGIAGIVESAIPGERDPNFTTGVIIPTVVQIAADALSYWTSMTCLYNKYWYPEQEKITLPVCFFHVTKIRQIWQNEISKKRVILFEPQEKLTLKKAADSIREGVMQTVVDNIVKQPKTYSMEITVPFQPLGRYVTEGVKGITDAINMVTELMRPANDEINNIMNDTFSSLLSAAGSAVKMGSQYAQLAGKLPNMQGVSYINVNSLEAMADSPKVLTMKMWTGYDFKYVTITGMTTDKNTVEDDVIRATLELQELPVLSITPIDDAKLEDPTANNWVVIAVSAVYGAMVEPLTSFLRIKEAAGDDPIETPLPTGRN